MLYATKLSFAPYNKIGLLCENYFAEACVIIATRRCIASESGTIFAPWCCRAATGTLTLSREMVTSTEL